MTGHDDDQLEELLAEQVRYYSARAPEYTENALDDLDAGVASIAGEQIEAAIKEIAPSGDVLELACGPGTWTELLLETADTVTAVDASSEMLSLAASSIGAATDRIRFVQADLFQWRPDRRYDDVFFGFWLSHVPLERFESFWSAVATALKPRGRVIFVDDGFRTERELVDGPESSTIERRLSDGTRFRAVKVPHRAESLERRLAGLGWDIRVRQLHGPFFLGVGSLGA